MVDATFGYTSTFERSGFQALPFYIDREQKGFLDCYRPARAPHYARIAFKLTCELISTAIKAITITI